MTTSRRTAVPLALVLVAVLGLGVGLASCGDEQRIIKAEFENVRGLLAGNDLRLNGARVGGIEDIELTDRGTAMVSIALDDDAPAPRADAAATVRPVDLLGDIYLSYSPGTSPRRLQGSIPLARTANAPRLADLLRTFRPKVRAGLQAMIAELGAGLERRGVDLGRAAVELRPALEATDGVMRELASQNTGLRRLVNDAHRVTREIAARKDDVEGTITSLAHTLQAIADRAPHLDRGVTRLAPTLAQLRGTTVRLASTAVSARPLFRGLDRVAPGLAQTADQLGPFLDKTRKSAAATSPVLRRTRSFLKTGSEAFPRMGRGIAALGGAAPQFASLTETLRRLAPIASVALFDQVASEGREPGNQPLEPGEDPLRHYWRGAALLSCHSFGVKIEAGCLRRTLPSPKRRAKPAPRSPVRPMPRPRPATRPRPEGGRQTLEDELRDLKERVDGVLGGLPGLKDLPVPSPAPQGSPDHDEALLDFLLRP